MSRQIQKILIMGVLALGAFVSSTPASVLWYSRFETENGVAVTSGQAISSTANMIDTETGGTRGSATDVVGDTYISNPIPASVDPRGAAGSFAISTAADNKWYINTAVPSNVDGEVTIEGFFNLREDVTTTGHRRIVRQNRSSNASQLRLGPVLEYSESLGGAVFCGLYTVSISGVLSYPVAWGNTLLSKDQWHHFAMTVDHDDMANTDTIRGYLDGRLEYEAVAIPNLVGPGSSSFIIGGTSGATAVDAFVGELDEIRISSGVLSPSEFLIPEPGAAILLGAGLLVLRRRR